MTSGGIPGDEFCLAERIKDFMAFNKRNLAAGAKEMRSVAKRLLAWADDLEKSLAPAEMPEDENPPAASEGTASEAAPAECGELAEAVKDPAPPTLSQVKAFLTEKCAAGYSARVKALIASFGATTLSEVPAESLGDLLDAALLIGQEEEEGEDRAG